MLPAALLLLCSCTAESGSDAEPDASGSVTAVPDAPASQPSDPLATAAAVITPVATTADPPTTPASAPLTATTTPLTTTSPATATIATTTTTPPITTPTTTPATTTVPGLAGRATDVVQVVELGRSVEGRPITAIQRGTPGGTVVLVIGVIHGNEDDGVAVLDELATATVPEGIDLWLIESINPDGQAAGQRGNANLVDLNRNFPFEWAPLEMPGEPQYAGTGPASEPETQALVDFVTRLQPALGIWYHQDLFRIAPGRGLDGELRSRYAGLTALPLESISGGTYTGVAATWQRNAVDGGVSFIVELGPTLSPAEAATHAAAVLDVATLVMAG